MAPTFPQPLLTENELVAWLGLSLPTLQRLRSTGKGPRFIRLSKRRIAYREPDVDEWLESRAISGIGRTIRPEQAPLPASGGERN